MALFRPESSAGTASNAAYATIAGEALYIQSQRVYGPHGYNSIKSASHAIEANTAKTASFADNFNVAGNLTVAGTASVAYLITTYESSSIIYSSGSTKFGDDLNDTHIFTGSVYITNSLNLVGSLNATSITASFTGSLTGSLFGTASYVTGSIFSANFSRVLGCLAAASYNEY